MGAFADGFVLGMPRRMSLLAGTGLASLFAAGLTVVSRPASAQLPTGGQVTAGSASISQSGNRMDITQSSSRAAIDWTGFSIGGNNAVHFQQPNSSAVALNRVNGRDPSVIAGQLTANGRLILINPNGVAFTPTARVDTAGLVASTIGISNGDFMAGRMNFDQPGRPGASVVNEGEITVREGGLAALVAPEVRNSGTIRARLGKVALAGAESFVLDPRGDGLISFEVSREGPARQTRAENTGRIEAQGGQVTIGAASARGIVAGVVNIEGQVIATSVGTSNGVVSFGSGENGATTVAGSVDVRGTQAGERGGRVTATGDRVRVASTARIDASGAAGGGEVKIGGDLQGRGTTPRARATDVERGAVIRADATGTGDGGSVIVWSDEYTRFMGTISAVGGPQGGNGGFAEVSGKLWLGFDGTVDLRAPFGRTGTLLLDPTDITISAAANNDITTTSPFQFVDNTAPPSTNGTSNLNVTTLQTALAGGNVVVSTAAGTGAPSGGTITVSDAVTWTSGNSLSLQSTTGIAINAAVTSTADGTPGGVLNGALSLSVSGTGNITQTAAGVIRTAALTATAADGAVALDTVASRVGSITGSAVGQFAFHSSSALTATGITVTGASAEARIRSDAGLTVSGPINVSAGAAASRIALRGASIAVATGALDSGGGTVSYATGATPSFTGLPAESPYAGTAPSRVEFRTTTAGDTIAAGTGAAGATLNLDTATLDRFAPAATTATMRIGASTTTATEVASGQVTVTGISRPGTTLILESGAAGANAITQGVAPGDAISVASLTATASAGSVGLSNAANAVGTVAGSGAGFAFSSSGALATGVIGSSGAVSLTAGGLLSINGALNATGQTVSLTGVGINQAAAITATSLTANGGAGAVVLDTVANAVGTVSGGGVGFAFRDTDALATGVITSTGAVSLTAGGLLSINGALNAAGQSVTLTGVGIDQTAAISANALGAFGGTGGVALDSVANDVAGVGGDATGAFRYGDANALAIGTVTAGGPVAITAGGVLTVASGFGGITGTGDVQLQSASNIVVDQAVTAGTGATLRFETGLGGTLTVNSTLAVPNGISEFVTDNFAGAGGFASNNARAALSIIRTVTPGRSIGFGDGTLAGGLVLSTAQLAGLVSRENAQTRVGSLGQTGLNGLPESAAGRVESAGFDLIGRTLTLESNFGPGNAIRTLGSTSNGQLAARAPLGSVDLGASNSVSGINVVTSGTLTFANTTGFEVRGIEATAVTLSATSGDITQSLTGAISGTTLTVNATGGAVVLDTAANAVTSVRGSAVGQFVFRDANALTVNEVTVTGANAQASFDAGGALTVTGPINVSAGAAGSRIALRGTSIAIDPAALNSGGGTVAYAANAVPTVGGGLSPYTGIAPSRVEFRTATAGTIAAGTGAGGSTLNLDTATLDRFAPGASTATLRIGAAATTASEAASGQVEITGISRPGTTLILESGTAVSQTGAIAANELVAIAGGAAGTVTLGDAANEVAILSGRGAGGFTYVNATGFVVGGAGVAGPNGTGSGINQSNGPGPGGTGPITPGLVSLTATTGTITQTAPIAATGLLAVADGAGGAVTLGNTNNEVATLSGRGTGGFTYVDATGFAVGTVAGVSGIEAAGQTVRLEALNGNITQTQRILASGLAVAADGGVRLDHPNNAISGTIAGIAGALEFTFVNGGSFAVGTVGGLSGISAAGVPVSLTATNGNITQGGAANERINAASLAAIASGVTGTVTLGNAANEVGSISGLGRGGFTYVDATGFAVAGINQAVPAAQLGQVSLTATTGNITQATGAANAISATALTASALDTTGVAGTGSVTLGNAANEVASLSGRGAGGFTYVDATGFDVAAGGINQGAGVVAGTVSLTATTGSITQTGAIAATDLAAVAAGAGGAVTLGSAANEVATLTGRGAGGFTYVDATGFDVAAGGINQGGGVAAGTVSLTATTGSITQTGALAATSLSAAAVAAGGAVTLGNTANEVATLTGRGAAGFTYVDATGFEVRGINQGPGAVAGQVSLTAQAGSITQGANPADAILATALTAVGGGPTGAVTLANAGNDATSIAGRGQAGFTYVDANEFTVAGINQGPGVVRGTVSLTATVGDISQGATVGEAIAATTLTANAINGTVTLGNAFSDVASISGQAGGDFTFTSQTGFSVSGITAGLGGGVAGAVRLEAVTGTISQTGVIVGRSLNAAASAGSVTLDSLANTIGTAGVAGTVSGSAAGAGNDFAFRNAFGFVVDGISAPDLVSLTADIGNITQTAAISAGRLSAAASAGSVTLDSLANAIGTAGVAGTVSGSAAGAGNDFAFRNAFGFVVGGISAPDLVSLTADAGSITQTAAISAGRLSAAASAGNVTLDNPANIAGSVAGAALGVGNGFTYVGGAGFQVAGITAGDQVSLTAEAGSITQGALAGDAITALGLRAVANLGSVTLDNAANAVGTGLVLGRVSGSASGIGGDFTFRNGGRFEVAGIAATNQVALTADAGDITQAGGLGGRISATALTATANAGSVTLDNPTNAAGSVAGAALGAGGDFTYVGGTGFQVAGITATDQVSLSADSGSITQAAGAAARISAARLSAAASPGDVLLDNPDNTVGLVSGSASGFSSRFVYVGGPGPQPGATGFQVGDVSAVSVLLRAVTGNITQPGVINAFSDGLEMRAETGSITTGAINSGGQVLINARQDVAIEGTLDASGQPISLTAQVGDISQTARILGAGLTADAAAGTVTLTDTGNAVGSIAGRALGAGHDFSFANSTSFAVAGIQAARLIDLRANAGSITQTAPLSAADLVANAPGGGVTLSNAGNDVLTLTGAASGAFAFRDATGLTVNNVSAGTAGLSLRAGGELRINGNLTTLGAGIARLQSGAALVQQAGSTITAGSLLAIAGSELNLANSQTNQFATFAGRGSAVDVRNRTSLAIGTIAGDATVNDGATQAGVTAASTIRILVADPTAPSAVRNLIVNSVVGAPRIQLTLGTGPGTLQVNQNLLRGPGGVGDAQVVLLDVTGRLLPNSPDLLALPTFSGLSGTPPNVPIAIPIGPNTDAAIDLTAQAMPGTSLYLLLNGGAATNSQNTLTIQGLAVYPGTLGSTQVTLTGVTLSGQGGQVAATQSGVATRADNRFTVNNCPIGTVACIVLPPTTPSVPRFPEDLQVGTLPPRIDASTLTFINLGAEDTEDYEDEGRIAVGRPTRVQR